MVNDKTSSSHRVGAQENQERLVGRMLGLDELSSSLKKRVQQRLSETKESGVLVGALLGRGEWDIRPILLEDAQLTLLRFIHADCRMEGSFRFNTSELLHSLSHLYGSTGSVDGQFWVRRPYYDRVLSDEARAQEMVGSMSPSQLLRKILCEVESLHAQKLFHGHLVLSNLTISTEGLQLLDVGLSVFDKERWKLIPTAPGELQEGAPSSRTDVYWLAQLLETFVPDTFENLRVKMRSSEPDERPSIEEVVWELFPNERAHQQQPSSPALLHRPSSVPSGKLIVPHSKAQVDARDALKEKNRESSSRAQVPSADDRGESQPVYDPPPLKEEVRRPSPEQKSESLNSLWLLLFVFVGLSSYFFYHQGYFSFPQSEEVSSRPYTSLWQVGGVDERHQVAQAAIVDNIAEAQKAIVRTALVGKEIPMVANDFLFQVFSTQHGADFSQDDVRTILRIALAPLLEDLNLPAPELSSLDPRVTLVLLRSLGFDNEQSWFSSYSTKQFFELSEPARSVFRTLDRHGESNLSSRLVRATAVLASDPSHKSAWKVVLQEVAKKGEFASTLVPWVPFFEQAFTPESDLWKEFIAVAPAFAWFDNAKIVSWVKVSPVERLFLFFSPQAYVGLSRAQLFDLLTHPESYIRNQAEAALLKTAKSKGMKETLQVLARPEGRLSRDQNVALLSAFDESDGDVFYSYLSKWFDTAPDPHVVLKLLIARKGIVELDPFNVEAARYLTRMKWDPSLEELRGLSGHPEILARAFAYAQLDPQVPQERELLRDMASIEPSSRIRNQLQKKLSLSTR